MLEKISSDENFATQESARPTAIDALDYWRLCDHLSVVQAAMLIVGSDPVHFTPSLQKQPRGYQAAEAALDQAIKAGTLAARTPASPDIDFDFDPRFTTIAVEDLRTWLKSRGFTTGFFFPEPRQTKPDYLNPQHECYSPKLAAAIGAWETISGNSALRANKTVKQALVIWLRQNGNKFGLTKDDGNPNEQGIEEVAKIANWDAKGGAPKTPY